MKILSFFFVDNIFTQNFKRSQFFLTILVHFRPSNVILHFYFIDFYFIDFYLQSGILTFPICFCSTFVLTLFFV